MLNRRLRTIIAVILLLGGSLYGLHVLVVYNVKRIITDEISSQTNGRFNLHIGRVKIKYNTLSLEILESKINILDSAIANEVVMIETPYIAIHLSAFSGLVFRKELSIDSLICDMPHIIIYPHKKSNQSVSLSHEMGEILISIRKTLDALEIEKLRIRGGSVTINPSRAELRPIELKDLNLGIDHFVVNQEESNKKALLHNNDIHFYAGRQSFSSSDTTRTYFFKSIDITTKNKWVIVDSCFFNGKRKGINYSIFFKQLRLVNVDFNKLYGENILRTDSALCNGVKISLFLDIGNRKSRKSSEQITEESMKDLTKDLEIKYASVTGSDIDLITKRGDRIETFSSKHHSFALFDVGMNAGLRSPLRIGEIRFQVLNYHGYSDDSLFSITFESVSLKNHDLILNNFNVTPTERYKGHLRNQAAIDQLTLKNISFAAALFDKKLVTDEIILNRPFIHVVMNDENEQEHKTVLEVMKTLDQSFGIKKATIYKGTIVSDHTSKPRTLHIEGLSTVLHSSVLLSASGVREILNTVEYLETDKIEFRNGEEKIRINKLKWSSRHNLTIAEAELTDNAGKYALIHQIAADGLYIHHKNEFKLETLSWEDAKIIFENKDSVKQTSSAQAWPLVAANQVDLRNIDLQYESSGEVYAKGNIEKFTAENFQFSSPQDIKYNNLKIRGDNIAAQKGDAYFQVEKFDVQDNGNSTLNKLSYHHHQKTDSTEVEIQEINFVPDISASVSKKSIIIKSVNADHVYLFVHKTDSGKPTKTNALLPDLNLGKAALTDVSTDVTMQSKHGNIIIFSNKGKATFDNIQLSSSSFSIDNCISETQSLNLNYRDSIHFSTSKGGIKIQVENFKASEDNITAKLRHIAVNAEYILINREPAERPLKYDHVIADAENMIISYPFKEGSLQQLFSQPDFTINNISADFRTGKHKVGIDKISYSKYSATLNINGIHYVPLLDRQVYGLVYHRQEDYIEAHTGLITLDHFDLVENIFSKHLQGGNLSVEDLDLKAFKDKRLPPAPEKYKKLPTALLKSIPFPLELKSVELIDANITYSEFSAKTGREGMVTLNRVQVRVENIKNKKINQRDSLSMVAQAWLQDSAKISINFRESYADTLSGFVLKVTAQPFDLTLLNNITEPLAGVSIRSGYLRYLSMTAIGREYISLGEMKFFYDNLSIDVFGNKEETQRSILSTFTNMVANDIIVKDENFSKTSIVYFERLRHKSVFNYWIKITLSGIMTTVGVKQNTIYKRRYRKYLRKNNIPSIKPTT